MTISDSRDLVCKRCGVEYTLAFNERSYLCPECMKTFQVTRQNAKLPLYHYIYNTLEKYDLNDRRMKRFVKEGKSFHHLRHEYDILHKCALEIEEQTAKYPEAIAESKQLLQTWYDKWPALKLLE